MPKWLIALIWFDIGLMCGNWLNNPTNMEKAYKAGKWTREHILRFPPLPAHNKGEAE